MSHVIRTLGDLGASLTLAPERYRAGAMAAEGGELHAQGAASAAHLGARVVERRERVTGEGLAGALVIDTTHARDGVLDMAAAARATAASPSASAKRRVHPGDLLVSRLRPYLRQVALAHPDALAPWGDRVIACSTEFYVLAPRDRADCVADLLPWLLGARAQAVLAAAQEGGHHPRVPADLLLAMQPPAAPPRARHARAQAVMDALAAIYAAAETYARVLA
jgi:hypothetical protein